MFLFSPANNGALLVCTTPFYFFSISIVLRVVIVSEKAVWEVDFESIEILRCSGDERMMKWMRRWRSAAIEVATLTVIGNVFDWCCCW